MKKILLQLMGIVLTSSLFAQTTIENFAYGTATGTAADSLMSPTFGGSVWRRHSGFTGPVMYLGSSLTYATYPSSGIGGSLGFTFAKGFAQDINRSTIAYSSGSVYVSFLLNITASGGAGGLDAYFFHVMDTAFNTAFRGRHYIKDGSVANTFKIGLGKTATSTPAYSSADYPLNTPILVVMKYKFDALNPDSVTEYIFTSGIPSTEPTVPTLIAPDIVSAADLAILNAVAIRQHPTGSTMTGIVDGIRVSNSWANAPLPVTLVSFEGNLNANNTTLLSWATSSELENSGFEIERSIDGNEFETIGFVKGAGNSNIIRKYTFEYGSDASAYYRLKQIDFDGKSTYSAIISVNNTDGITTTSPNPFNDNIELLSNTLISHAEIVDMMGKVVLSETINNNAGQLNASDLSKGIYFIKIYQGETVTTKRIIKAN